MYKNRAKNDIFKKFLLNSCSITFGDGEIKKKPSEYIPNFSTYILSYLQNVPVPEIKAREFWNKTFCHFYFLHTYPDLKEFFRLLKGLISTSLSEFFRLLKGLCCIDTTGLLSTSLSACLRLLGLSKIRSIHGMKCVTLATMYFQKNLRTHIFAF